MRVTVRLFGTYRELVGIREIVLQFMDPPTLDVVADALRERYPILASLTDGMVLSVNGRVVSGGTVLSESDVVSVLPTVTGG